MLETILEVVRSFSVDNLPGTDVGVGVLGNVLVGLLAGAGESLLDLGRC